MRRYHVHILLAASSIGIDWAFVSQRRLIGRKNNPCLFSRQRNHSRKRPFPNKGNATKIEAFEEVDVYGQCQLFPLNKRLSSMNGKAAEEVVRYRLANNLDINRQSFNIALKCYAKEKTWESAVAADNFLSFQWGHANCLQPDSYSYSAVINAYAKAATPAAASRAKALLDEYSRRRGPPHEVLINTVLDAYATTGQGAQAQALLATIDEPTIWSYNSVLKAYRNDPRQAQAILRTIPVADAISYTIVLNAWAKARKYHHVDALLTELEEKWERTGEQRFQPDIFCYTAALCPELASSIWQRIKSHNVPINDVFLNSWIHCLSKAKNIAPNVAVQQAEQARILSKNFGLSMVTTTSLMTVLARSGTKKAMARALELLDELEDCWRTNGKPEKMRPTAQLYAATLNVVAKADGSYTTANQLVQRMNELYRETGANDLSPNSYVFCQLFQILAKSKTPKAVLKGKELLFEMKRLHDEGFSNVRPDATTYSHWLNCLTKSTLIDNTPEIATRILEDVEEAFAAGDNFLKPNSLLYSAVLQAYAKSGKGGEAASTLLDRMNQDYLTGNKLYAKPSVLHYNAVIDAWAREGNHQSAQETFHEMIRREVSPTVRSYNAVMLAFKSSGDPDAPELGEEWLKIMPLTPTRVTICTLMGIWADSDRPNAAVRVRELLDYLLETSYRREDDGTVHIIHEDLLPDAIVFNTCIEAQLKYGEPVHPVIEQMNRLYAQTGFARPNELTSRLVDG